MASSAPAIIFLTACWKRNYKKYGDFGYMLGMLEAGHMGQNILLAVTALDLNACPLRGFVDETVSRILDIDAAIEQPVYAIALG
jgi:SagB-type dehydrogenase family enzyme